MAQSVDNIVTKGFFGSLDKTLTFRQRAGVTIISKKRRASSIAPTDAMLAVRAKFLTAVAYGKKAIKNAATKALYNSAATGMLSGFNLATADAFTPPVVNSIAVDKYHGAVGDPITIDATDDFKVNGVSVAIHDAAGNLIEQGNAVLQTDSPDWLYTATVANAAPAGCKISATATDLPGNTGSLVVTL
jgi:hypothetical protein